MSRKPPLRHPLKPRNPPATNMNDSPPSANSSSRRTRRTQTISDLLITLCGVFLLYHAFAEIADLKGFHAYLLGLHFLPYWLTGVGGVFIPGLLLTLGLILTFRKRIQKESSVASAAIVSFAAFLVALTIAVYTALTASSGCAACHKLETRSFNFKAWIPAATYLAALALNAAGLLLDNSDSE